MSNTTEEKKNQIKMKAQNKGKVAQNDTQQNFIINGRSCDDCQIM